MCDTSIYVPLCICFERMLSLQVKNTPYDDCKRYHVYSTDIRMDAKSTCEAFIRAKYVLHRKEYQ